MAFICVAIYYNCSLLSKFMSPKQCKYLRITGSKIPIEQMNKHKIN